MLSLVRHIWFHDAFAESKVKRKAKGSKGAGQFAVSAGAGEAQPEKKGKKPKAKEPKPEEPKAPPKPKKPKAPTKAQLYAKVQELDLERGVSGKYKKAGLSKLQALVAGALGWKPDLTGYSGSYNPLKHNWGSAPSSQMGEIKAILAGIDFPATAKKEKPAGPPKLGSKADLAAKAAGLGIKLAKNTPVYKIKEVIALIEREKKALAAAHEQGKQGAASAQAFSGPWSPNVATKQHKKAIAIYTDGGYSPLNMGLRQGTIPKEHVKTAKYLDEILNNSSYRHDLFRGVSSNTLEKISKQTKGLKPGQIFGDLGYGSYSKSEKFARGWKPVCIRAFGGGPDCADIQTFSGIPGEYEVLAARGMKMKIKKWDPKTKTLDIQILGADPSKAASHDSTCPEEAGFAPVSGQMSLQERWDLDEQDPNFMMGA